MMLVVGALGKSRLLIPPPCVLPCFLVGPSLPASVFTSVKGSYAWPLPFLGPPWVAQRLQWS